MNPALILFIKNPIPGKTKTRLAASVGDDMALKMYGILVRWTRDQAAGLENSVTRYVYYSEETVPEGDFTEQIFRQRTQAGKDLGERMHNAFEEVFAAGHDRIIIIGSDCPGVTTEYLQRAFEQLTDTDAVIGPALDGGYTLLGLRKLSPTLFVDMDWSTDRVLPATVARCKELGWSVQQLPTLSDVDHLEDWYSYGWTLPME